MRRAVSSRAGLIIVLSLAACSAVLFWRVSSLTDMAQQYGHVSAPRGVIDDWFVVYQQSRIISGGDREWANDDVVEHRFARYALTSRRDETIDTVVTDNQLGFGNPWMRQNGDSEIVFVRRRDSAEDTVRIDVMNRPAADQTGDWVAALPSPDGRDLVLLSPGNKGMVQMKLADGSVKVISTAGKIDSGYLQPTAWAEDGSKVYLRTVFEGGGFVYGLWTIDVASGALKEITAMRKLKLMNYVIYPASHQVIGSTFVCESMERCGLGPSKLYLIDMNTDQATIVADSQDFAFIDPLLSPDGKRIVYRLDNGSATSADVWLRTVGADAPTTSIISGRALAWTPDGTSLILDRDDELQLFNLTDKYITTIAQRRGRYGDPDYQGLEFVGLLRQ